jgi:hypothetical protein
LISYFNLYIKNLYSSYIYHDIIDILNDINKKYYDTCNLLLSNYNIGSTIGKYTYSTISETNFNFNDIINNEFSNNYRFNLIKNNINNHQFIYDKKLQNLTTIIDNLNNTINNILNNITKYTINRNLLNINNIIFDKTIDKFDINNFQIFIFNNIFDSNNNFTSTFLPNIIINNLNQKFVINSTTLKNGLLDLFNSFNK